MTESTTEAPSNSVPTFTGTTEAPTSTSAEFTLGRASFSKLPATVAPLKYDRDKVTAGVFHIGASKFFLSHLCTYLQELLPIDPSWGVIATSIRSDAMVKALAKQDGGYVLVVCENGDIRPEVLAPIVETLYGPDDPKAYAQRMADPAIKLITITVSNNGYCLKDGHLNIGHKEVANDMEKPDEPQSIYGYLAAGLKLRQQKNAPVVIMSLDNIEHNSQTFKLALLSYLTKTDPELATWVESNVSFPVTLVDRITPDKMTPSFLSQVREEIGFDSSVVVKCEAYRELVVERTDGIEELENAGVRFVKNCSPHWSKKFYLVNAGHQIPAIVGLRLGSTFIHEAMSHSAIARLLARAHKEWKTFLEGDAEELKTYAATVRRRFADEAPNDEISRVVARTTSKVSDRLLSSVELAYLTTHKVIKVPTFVTAVWLLNLSRLDEAGKHMALNDADAEKLHAVYDGMMDWLKALDKDADPLSVTDKTCQLLVSISENVNYPRFDRLAECDEFVEDLAWSLVTIHRLGVEKAIDALLAR
jgi:mannitol 2-dehydrogenase